MKILENGPEGVKVLKPKVYKDNRGHFYESLNIKELNKILKKKIIVKQSNVQFQKKMFLEDFTFKNIHLLKIN